MESVESRRIRRRESLGHRSPPICVGRYPDPPYRTVSNEFDALSKTAPHLAAILSRTASRTKKVFPFKSSTVSSSPIIASSRPASEYRPSSTQSFLLRLATFKITTYANKAPAVDAVAAAKCGWINDGKDRLICGICDVSWVVAGTQGMSRDAGMFVESKPKVGFD